MSATVHDTKHAHQATKTAEHPPLTIEVDNEAMKKARKQTAFYPNLRASNQPKKPFSRSAAKRGSVMALGSIEHLQHYFTKTGLAAKKKPVGMSKSNFVPAIGGHMKSPSVSSPGGIPELHFDLPPSPAVPMVIHHPFPPFVKTYQTDPEALKPGVIRELEAVSSAWGLGDVQPSQSQPQLLIADSKAPAGGNIDVLNLLSTTTGAIRSVSNYVVSLPDENHYARGPSQPASFRHTKFAPQTASRIGKPSASAQPARDDPLARIRPCALDVLSTLRELEEGARISVADDHEVLSDYGSDAGRRPSISGERDSSVTVSVVKADGRRETVNVWSDEEEGFSTDSEEKREPWDRRLILGGGFLYRQDVRAEDLAEERKVIARYLDVVDQVLFGGPRANGKRGWEVAAEKVEREDAARAKRSASGRLSPEPNSRPASRNSRREDSSITDGARNFLAVEEPEIVEEDEEFGVEDDQLPDWAKRSSFVDDSLARTRALLIALIPVDLLPLLPPPADLDDKTALLASLTSGQILCVSYNAGVRRSKKPWGYINPDSIHDVATLEAAEGDQEGDGEKEKKEKFEKRKGWTFRRTENLRLWAAALKLRYMIPVTPVPKAPYVAGAGGSRMGTPAASPTAQAFPPTVVSSVTGELLAPFDASLVAKREAGWEDMLEGLVLRWVEAVVLEKRRGV